jgi:hypothetical protein
MLWTGRHSPSDEISRDKWSDVCPVPQPSRFSFGAGSFESTPWNHPQMLDLCHEEVVCHRASTDGVCRSSVRPHQAPSHAQAIAQECAAPIYKAQRG